MNSVGTRERRRFRAGAIARWVAVLVLGSASALWADTRTVAWDAVSGSGVGYRVHYGTQSRVYATTMDVGANTTARITFDPGRRYYIAAQAYDDQGQISPLSVELIYDSPAQSSAAPVISNLSPSSGPVGTQVTIGGSNFGQTAGSVTFNGRSATPSSWSSNTIVVAVPSGATSGSVVVSIGGVASQGVTFSVSGTQTGPGQVTSPAPGSTLTASTVQVQWTGGTGITEYWLYVGTAAGGNDFFSQGTAGLSATVSGLPTDGRRLYLRLWSSSSGNWTHQDYTYTAASQGASAVRAELTTPPPSSTLTTSTVTFQWTGGTGVAQYGLHVGTSPGGDNLFSRGGVTSLSATVSGLPTDGRTVYVRLWSEINGSSLYNDYTYATAAQGTSAVRAELTTPPPSSTLAASTVTFQWTGGTGVTQYGLHLGTSVGGNDVFSQNGHRGLSATVSGLPTDGRTLYARVWSEIGGSWVYRDYTYTAGSAGSGSGSGGTGPGQMATPAPGSTLTASTVTFQWTGGTGVVEYWLYVGTTGGGNDLFSRGTGSALSATVAGLPSDGRRIYVQLWSSFNGDWRSNDYTYTAPTQGASAVRAELTTPPPGSSLTSSTVTFQWIGGTGVTQYGLHLGTSPGGSDLFTQGGHSGLSATVAGLPTDGRTIYARLWSQVSGSWLYGDYTYTARSTSTTGPGQVTTPPPSSTLTASTVTVEWTGGSGATDYWLYVGTTPGGNELFSQGAGTNLRMTVTGLPTDGRALYLRLWSLINGTWQVRDYTYSAAGR